MHRLPARVCIVDTKKERIAVLEARKLGIPVIAVIDTNCDPDEVDYPIPGNDDAIRSVALLTRVVADAVADGLIARAGRAAGDEKPAEATCDGVIGAADEPLAEWERELLEGARPMPRPPRPRSRPPRRQRPTPRPISPARDQPRGSRRDRRGGGSGADAGTAEAPPMRRQSRLPPRGSGPIATRPRPRPR